MEHNFDRYRCGIPFPLDIETHSGATFYPACRSCGTRFEIERAPEGWIGRIIPPSSQATTRGNEDRAKPCTSRT
jgi:hypothetical protein